MIGGMLKIEGELEVLSPLHIGSGETGRSKDVVAEKTPGQMTEVEIGLFCADVDHSPVIPGASLKGALRALADAADRDRLFGPETIGDEGARAGRLTFWTARRAPKDVAGLDAAPHAQADLAYAEDGDRPKGENESHASVGMYIDSRTAIDPQLGVAHQGRLFHRQMVPEGTTFKLRMALLGEDPQDMAALARVLACMRHGFRLGAGATGDLGRVRLASSGLTVTRHGLEGDADASAMVETLIAQAATPVSKTVRRVRLTLRCDGPFLVNDSTTAARRDQTKNMDGESEAPHLSPLKGCGDMQNTPRLPGASLKGALRDKAQWIERMSDPTKTDDRDAVHWRDGLQNAATSRLFGYNGWRGLLHIRNMKCTGHDGFADLTSVRLDRFSGAPIDAGLFKTTAAVNPVFTVELALTRRGGHPNDEDTRLFDALVEAITAEGLMLGHGSNKGYGWFDVDADHETQSTEAA